MCGICGILSLSSIPIDSQEILRMRDIMFHRGPDDEGIFLGEGIGLGHRRLSIIDLEMGHQPMFNEDRSVVVVYNGEIYNYVELKKQSEEKGHRYATNSDTEVILHLYEEDGVNLVSKLKGMFAFALWDRKKRLLFLARDRLGIKPLYYSQYGGRFIFASEIKSILESDGFEREINTDELTCFILYGYVYGERTLFQNIYKLLPGHILLLKNGKINIQKYWDVPIPPNAIGENKELHQRLDELLQESVKSHLMSDVPVGVFLSGGLDSSTIVYYMTRMNHQRPDTFSVGFGKPSFNELKYAKIIADHFHTHHHSLIFTEESFLQFLTKMIWHNDEPLSDPASIPIYCLAKLAKENNVSVLLCGEGADELFAGYSNYPAFVRDATLAPFVPKFMIHSLSKIFSVIKLNHFVEIAERYQMSLKDILERHMTKESDRVNLILSSNKQETYIGSLFSQIRSNTDPLSMILYIGLKASLVSLLMRQDKMSMAASVETRVPFLDHDLVEFVWNLPNQYKLKGRKGKILLKTLALNYLPQEIVNRKKMGFPVPTTLWFSQNKNILGFLKEKRSTERPYFNGREILNIVDNYEKGDLSYGSLVWKLLNLELWIRIYFENERY